MIFGQSYSFTETTKDYSLLQSCLFVQVESSLILFSQTGLASKGNKEQIAHSRGHHTQSKYVCTRCFLFL